MTGLMNSSMDVNKLNYSIKTEKFKSSCKDLLKLVFPDWFDNSDNPNRDIHDSSDKIELIQCKDGITNKCKLFFFVQVY